MGNYILRAITQDGSIRAFFADTTDLVEKAREIHNTSPVVTDAFGRVLTATAIISGLLKSPNDTITVQIKSDGPIGGILAVSDADLNVRGYVNNPQVESKINSNGKLDVAAAVGVNGELRVIKDIGLKEPYIGMVRLKTGEIADDFSYYFGISEQIPTVIALGTLLNKEGKVERAGGFLIQLLPNSSEMHIDFLEEKIKNIESLSTMFKKNLTVDDIFENVLGELGMVVLEKKDCGYKCNCSFDKMTKNLITIGKTELQEIYDELGEAELKCYFCDTAYHFDNEKLKEIIEMAKG